jgi:hypothetical protein
VRGLAALEKAPTAPADGDDTAAPVPQAPVRQSLESMLRQAQEYDVISFDIFDTLLLRRVAEPRDVFALTAQRLGMTQVQVSRREKKILAALREQLQ